MAKPSDKAFAAVAAELGTAASRCLFVDDALINIQSAERLGYKVHHFTGTTELDEFMTSQETVPTDEP